MHTKHTTLSLILIALFFAQGCDNSKLEQLEADLVETRKQIEKSHDDWVHTKRKLKHATDDIEKITAKNQKLVLTKLKYESLLSDVNALRRIIEQHEQVKAQIARFNREARKYQQPEALFERMLNDTVYIKIDDSERLTQRMGSAGASAYLQEAIASITSVQGIECIDFDFEEGDHAVPGKYCK